MASVMIRCPQTGEAVEAGLDIDVEKSRDVTISRGVLGWCPECGDQHPWTQQDAYLAG